MVVIRLSRAGAKKRPFYHICVSDRRNKRDGKFIERIGFYNPIAKDTEEKIRFDHERYDHWLSVGAKPSDTVLMLLKRSKMSEDELQSETTKWLARLNKTFGTGLDSKKLLKTGGEDEHSTHQEKIDKKESSKTSQHLYTVLMRNKLQRT